MLKRKVQNSRLPCVQGGRAIEEAINPMLAGLLDVSLSPPRVAIRDEHLGIHFTNGEIS
jgi:hypothetical protein